MNRLKRWLAVCLLCLLTASAAAPAAAAASDTGFRDVPAGHWAASEIRRAVDAGLVQGVSAAEFGLGRPMTRAAFTVVLCRFFGWEMQTPSQGSFADNRNPAAWYYSAVETACANGAVVRKAENFRPDDPITREEMAVMLVRALGFTALAGLDQGLECPFGDVTTNQGYLTMAYYLGISQGAGDGSFAPDRAATREQAVVMLMRVYDRWKAGAPERIGVTTFAEQLTDFRGCGAVALSGPRLTSVGGLSSLPAAETAAAARDAVRASGAKVLLGVSGSQTGLQDKPAAIARAIAAEAEAYDGVLLDVSKLPENRRKAYTALAEALRTELGDKLLYVAADAPESDGTRYGYDYAALAETADRLILRTCRYDTQTGGFPTMPQEPLEEVYYALAALSDSTDLSKCSLWLTTSGLGREGNRGGVSYYSAEKLAELLADPLTERYYSARYADGYLSRTVGDLRTVVWYHTGRAAEARTRLGAFFGVDSVCLSGIGDASEELLEGLA
ncbi:S-layer homology domain-containing protein [Dysosmobacter sp.]|uniref:S-layer homology domain-containing protein n=1 Tax=Dysosmobacter sp. TaxID=2591382 RepID=UPI002A8E5881|nr:S-layer homology domain-containing protein [Dysosmobacter sp.]MDY3281239.1 S-layer homology domain-containing protein [Dysosmobacter sp.]